MLVEIAIKNTILKTEIYMKQQKNAFSFSKIKDINLKVQKCTKKVFVWV